MKQLIIAIVVLMNTTNKKVIYDVNNEINSNHSPDDILVFTYDSSESGIEVVCPETCDDSYPDEEEGPTPLTLSKEMRDLIEELDRRY